MSYANAITWQKIERADAALRLAMAEYDKAVSVNADRQKIEAGKRLREAVAAALKERE